MPDVPHTCHEADSPGLRTDRELLATNDVDDAEDVDEAELVALADAVDDAELVVVADEDPRGSDGPLPDHCVDADDGFVIIHTAAVGGKPTRSK